MEASHDFDLELIAAFIDGRLPPAERNRVIKLLAESDAAFEVYADAVRTRDDLGAGSVVPIPRPVPRSWVTVLPIALAAGLVIAVLPTVQARRADSVLATPTRSILQPLVTERDSRQLVAANTLATITRRTDLAAAIGPGWENHDWSVMRGGSTALVDSASALRLGVRATDLQVALAIGDRDLAARLAADMVELLAAVDLSNASRSDYEQIRARITAGDSIREIGSAASRVEGDLSALLDSPWFGFGKWLGAGEAAGRAHAASFFTSTETARFLNSGFVRAHLAPGELDALRQVSAQKGTISAREFETVQLTFAELIRRHGG